MNFSLVRRRALRALLISIVLGGCGGTSAMDRVAVVQLARDTARLEVGDTLRLHALPMLPPGYVPSLDWRSSAPQVASVEAGLVRALAVGRTVITASGDGASDSAVVVVEARRIPVVQINPPAATLSIGDTLLVSLLPMLPPGYVPTPITWSTSDSLIATVTPLVAGGTSAVVRARHLGMALLSAAGGGASGTSSITVK